ncbi:MAG: Fic family protein [Gemmatimonadetes bacterium]|nr:Fic family protein [Gemmatimonadota bacterium]MXX70355.1 Fic family protein [Gemmatimonadota bacterium]MYC91822.1 Fic family protein [Gemmatimonadota bacterium]MYG36827.1 Fic family protein [Gemmatimonadota bacterium]
MRRESTGTYESTVTGGETVRAFIPRPLPPTPRIRSRESLGTLLEEAAAALGRLDAVSRLLPDPDVFVYGAVRKEAVLSSQIEGIESSLDDLVLHEAGGVPSARAADVIETSHAVAALTHGVERLRGGFPISNRLMREMHARLMASGRGKAMMPGEFRRSQNWIGGSRPGNAAFVPPPPNHVQACMADLERFIHDTNDGLPVLIKAGLAHVQFETIHPFLDGNGRVGRLLITLMLCDAGLLREPLLYLSLYFKRHRSTYYRLLGDIRHTGDWEAWLRFFLKGVREVAEAGFATAKCVSERVSEDRARIGQLGRRAGSALRVHQSLVERPASNIGNLAERTGLSAPTVAAALRVLEDLDIVREVTGRQRGRVFTYERYLAVLREAASERVAERS